MQNPVPAQPDPLVARLGRIHQAVADLNQRLSVPKRWTGGVTRGGRDDQAIAELQQRAELMEGWARDSEQKLQASNQKLQEALLAEEQRQRECGELRTVIREQQERLHLRETESRELVEQLSTQKDINAQLQARLEELEHALAGAKQTLVEQGDLLRQSESREATLKRRLRDFKRAG